MKVANKDAKDIILKSVTIKNYEMITLESAMGRVLYEDIYAKFDIPEVDKSAVDGYGLNANLNELFPQSFKIVAENRAGKSESEELQKNEAVFIMTGAVVPKGVNCIVRVEDVKVNEDKVTVGKAPKNGDMINFSGSEVKKGEIVFRRGDILDYKSVAMLSDLGYYQIKVFQRPRVGIVVTGDEVKEAWEESDKAGVKNSNLYILKGLIEPLAEVSYYGKVKDDKEEMKRVFKNALDENDILLTSGGVSKGKYDFTKEVAESLGLDIKFNSTNIKPGKPLIFGNRDKKLFFGLPGYPSALLINSFEYLIEAIRKLAGITEYKNKTFKAIAKEDFRVKKGVKNIIRAVVEFEEAKIYVKRVANQQTSNFISMTQSNAVVFADEDKGELKKGDLAECYFL